MYEKAKVRSFQSIVIIGAPRSGTNMLRDILCQFDKVSTWPCDEINYIWRHGNLSHPSDELPEKLATSSIKNYIRRRFNWVAEKNKASFVVEKTCANSLRVPFVDEVIRDAKYIYIVRDGLDVIGSARLRWTAKLDVPYIFRKMRFVPLLDLPYYALRYLRSRVYRLLSSDNRLEFWGPSLKGMDLLLKKYNLNEICALQWKKCVDYSDLAFSKIPDNKVYKLRYEDFVESPVQELIKIIDFIGLNVPDSTIKDSVKSVSSKSVGKGREKLTSVDKDSLMKIIDDTMVKHGYSF